VAIYGERWNDNGIATDTVDPVMDEQLAMFVVESHRRSHPSAAQASASQGTGDEDVEEDNTAIINDKVWWMTRCTRETDAGVQKRVCEEQGVDGHRQQYSLQGCSRKTNCQCHDSLAPVLRGLSGWQRETHQERGV